MIEARAAEAREVDRDRAVVVSIPVDPHQQTEKPLLQGGRIINRHIMPDRQVDPLRIEQTERPFDLRIREADLAEAVHRSGLPGRQGSPLPRQIAFEVRDVAAHHLDIYAPGLIEIAAEIGQFARKRRPILPHRLDHRVGAAGPPLVPLPELIPLFSAWCHVQHAPRRVPD